MQISQLNELLFKILYLAGAGIILSQILEADYLSSILFSMTFIVVFVLWVMSLYYHFSRGDAFVIIIAASALICVLLEGTISNLVITLPYMKKYMMFLCTIVFFQLIFKLKGSIKFNNYFHRLNTFIGLSLITVFVLRGGEMYVLNGVAVRYLTFGFSNPNLAAMFCSCIGICEFIDVFRKKRKFIKYIHLMIGAWMMYFVYETESRNCLLILMIFIAMYLYTGMKRELTVGKIQIFFIVIWPLLFVAIYLYAVEQEWFTNLFSFLISEGKNVTSRVDIWEKAVQAYSNSPIIGAYGKISGGRGISQMHNSLLDILTSYGSIVLVMVCIYLNKNLTVLAQNTKGKARNLYLLGFIAAYLMGMGEAALFSGGLGIYLYICGFLLLSKNEEEEQVTT